MQHDRLQLAHIPAEDLRNQVRHIVMRGSMESVPPDLLLRRDGAVDGVGGGRGREIKEERRVEDGHLCDAGEHHHGLGDTVGIGRVVQRREHR